jgi:dsDNA-specific endonuclease/ATPase MutS2
MEAYRNCSGKKIVFIHGKGEGVLRKALIDELKAHYAGCQWQDASFRQYGFGATLVTIRKK